MALDATTAIIGLAGVGIGAAATYLAAKRNNETNLAIAREKLQTENKLELEASKAIRELLLLPEWQLRSFEAIRKHIRGFSDDELRQLLIASGAVSFDERGTDRELWGLRERNSDRLSPSSRLPRLSVKGPSPCR
jgi:hypothetical protein